MYVRKTPEEFQEFFLYDWRAMVSIEKLNGKNIGHFKILSEEAKKIMGYRLDFFMFYNKKVFQVNMLQENL